jgi:transglutaminase-like putative cysteine protease
MSQIAWDLFGKTPESWERVQAVLDWVHTNVTFGYEFARPTPAISFLRALNIPARYATGYLGGIGVVASPSPMDFAAWLEVYMGGGWHTLDATSPVSVDCSWPAAATRSTWRSPPPSAPRTSRSLRSGPTRFPIHPMR